MCSDTQYDGVLERILLRRLQNHMSSVEYHHSSQHGFIPGHSTDTALWNLHQEAYSAFKTRSQIAALSIDISSAFDRAPHSIILQELIKAKTPDYLFQSIRSFLTNRTTTIKTQTNHLQIELNAGTPQGSVLSPYLFSLLMNTLPPFLPAEAKLIIYADDVLVLLPIPKISPSPLLQQLADILTTWSKEVRLPLNPEKCKLLRISRLIQAPHLTLQLQNQTVMESPTVKYLGVTLDTRLTYAEHIRNTVQKASRRLSAVDLPIRNSALRLRS